MQELIEQTAGNLDLDAATAEQAVGTLLSLVRANGDQTKVEELFDKLPGAGDLAAQYGSDDGGGGGLLGMLGGGAIGAPLAAVAKLKAVGLDMEQISVLGRTVLAYARTHAGEDLVRDVMSSIPGLNTYMS